MRLIISTLVLLSSLAACSDADKGEALVGSWAQVNAPAALQLKANIAKTDDGFTIEIKLPVPNQAPVVVTKTGQFKEGILKADGLEKIHLLAGSGHLMIGVNEFEAVK